MTWAGRSLRIVRGSHGRQPRRGREIAGTADLNCVDLLSPERRLKRGSRSRGAARPRAAGWGRMAAWSGRLFRSWICAASSCSIASVAVRLLPNDAG